MKVKEDNESELMQIMEHRRHKTLSMALKSFNHIQNMSLKGLEKNPDRLDNKSIKMVAEST